MPDGGEEEAAPTDDVVPDRIGPAGDPRVVREDSTFAGYVTGFDPSGYDDREALRARLGYRPRSGRRHCRPIWCEAGPRAYRRGHPTVRRAAMTIRTLRSERWVRGYLGGETVVDTRHALLFWEDPVPVPHYAFPRDDVRTDLLVETEAEGEDDRFFGPTGPVSAMYDLLVGKRRRRRAAWVRDDHALAHHVVLSWKPGVLDRWTEEDEEVIAHPRDPFSRVDAIPSSRHVEVSVGGTLLANTRSPVLLFETGLPTRYYLPSDDVHWEHLEEVAHRTVCPYKGYADRYWNAAGLQRIAWSYTDPYPAVGAIAGRVAFYNEHVDLRVDGALLERPRSPFSHERP